MYIEIDGKGYRSADNARDLIQWIDQLEVMLRQRDRFPTPKLRDQTMDQLQAARKVYLKIVRDGK